uniref:Uncharacterized protein n=1 Tax=Strigamia maritima TaxID=126957 RepID=T1IQY7_STRMM
MPSSGNGAIGSLDYTVDERIGLAKKSHEWKCYICGSIRDLLRKRTNHNVTTSAEAMELASQISFKSEGDHSIPASDLLVTKDSTTQLPFSRLINSSGPIPMPDQSGMVTDIANIPMMSSTSVVCHHNTESGDVKAGRDTPTTGDADSAVVHRDLFYSIAIVVICVAMAFLVFRRLFFIL